MASERCSVYPSATSGRSVSGLQEAILSASRGLQETSRLFFSAPEASKSRSRGPQQASWAHDALRDPFLIDSRLSREPSGPQKSPKSIVSLYAGFLASSKISALIIFPTRISNSKKLVDFCKLNDLQLHIWTVNSLDNLKICLDLGCDGIITDEPILFRQYINSQT